VYDFGANSANKNSKCQFIILKERKENSFVKKAKSIQSFSFLFLAFPSFFPICFLRLFLKTEPWNKRTSCCTILLRGVKNEEDFSPPFF